MRALMGGLAIVVATADRDRYRTALTMACAHAALGRPTRLFHDAAAVALLGDPTAELFAVALDLGVTMIACQTGLATANLSLADLDPGIEAGGMTALIAGLGEDRLVIC